uniref:G protein gamma domain-containing protein n=1 Tax=Callorhinchus milii TaxID=7868 RepID=A0A4W3HUM1_CALMI
MLIGFSIFRRPAEQLPLSYSLIASIERVKISNVSANVVHNCEQHMKNNPFEDKKPCIVL